MEWAGFRVRSEKATDASKEGDAALQHEQACVSQASHGMKQETTVSHVGCALAAPACTSITCYSPVGFTAGDDVGRGAGEDWEGEGLGEGAALGLGEEAAWGLGEEAAWGLGEEAGLGLEEGVGLGLGVGTGLGLAEGLGLALGEGVAPRGPHTPVARL